MNRLFNAILVATAVYAVPAAADVVYAVNYAVAQTGVTRTVLVAPVSAAPLEATKDILVAAFTQRLATERPGLAATDKDAKVFSTYAEANTWRDALIEKSKALGDTVDVLAAVPTPAIAPAAAVGAGVATKPTETPTAQTAWPFTGTEAKKLQLAASKTYDLPVEKLEAGFTFLLVPPGEFQMGSPPDEPGRRDDETLHAVRISKPFYMSKYELSVGFTSKPALQKWLNDLQAKAPQGFAFRLPTEAEWEYAARAGKSTAYQSGDQLYGAHYNETEQWPLYEYIRDGYVTGNCIDINDEPNIVDQNGCRFRTEPGKIQTARYVGNIRYTLTLVGRALPKGDEGTFQPNAWGLYDMPGRRREIVEDVYAPYPTQADVFTDPLQKVGDRVVVRGGHFRSPAADLRSAARESLPIDALATKMYDDLAVRLVLFKLAD